MGEANDHISSLIHFVNAAVFLIAAPQLLHRLGRQPMRLVGGILHVSGIVFLLTMSGMFHFCEYRYGSESSVTEAFRQLDHVGVWTMMAGFHTLPILLLLRGAWRWVSFATIWIAALTGIAVKTIWWGIFTLEQSFVLYSLASVVGVVVVCRLVKVYGLVFTRPLFLFWAFFLGAAAAFVGQPPDLIPGLFGQHELWHVGISAGAIVHWRFVLREATRTGEELQETEADPVGSPGCPL